MSSDRTVRFYFDFISPYSYLASQRIAHQPELRRIRFDLRPVVFGTMLSRHNAKGPGEIPSRRRIGLTDALLVAAYHGFAFEGPPTHPFNSLYALRSAAVVADPDARARLVERYFTAAWGEGRDLEDLAVLRSILAELGIDQDPEAAATSPAGRSIVRQNTEEALAAGAWGVPSFVVDGLVFFGQDRLELLAAYLRGDCAIDGHKLESMLTRPQPGRIT